MSDNRPGWITPEKLLKTIGDIYHCKDLDTLLYRILLETRSFVNADAGTIYLLAKGYLYFYLVQNDTLFINEHAKDKYIYSRSRLLIDKKSLAGYVAVTGEPLIVDDVYNIQGGLDYSFNPEYDQKSNYHTRSTLVVPIITRSDTVLGVIQLINAKDPDGNITTFTERDTLYVTQFANYAANAIENAKLSREMAFRMVEIASMRDPTETAEHAKRVSAISVELYTIWAKKRGISSREQRQTREVLKIAAILHDVGKVAISDNVLKKEGSLTPEEEYHVKCHTVYGARLFVRANSPWDSTASEVTLSHHERWDGTGYPGKINDLFSHRIEFGPGKKGEEIPIAARVVSIADVYDSLISERVYKKRWSKDEAIGYIREQSGKSFDPELTELFLQMEDTVQAIEQRYENL